ncbi:MAG: 2-octaprenyl-6-methoxyphenyl hydroxylase [marine bacterium B5-7]|nr:MAG: 2-octaprenyl-6-methoxyphenyl hydroxylase [marine bacterium B5-7]
MTSQHFDLMIAGGGLAGASLALALGNTGKRIAVVESFAADDSRQPSFDERTIALTYASKQVFKGIGIWPAIAADACPIESIHISDRGRFSSARLDRSDIGTDALGYVVPTRSLGTALHAALSSCQSITLHCPMTARGFARHDQAVSVECSNGVRLESPLLVIADGGRSTLGAEAGLALNARLYRQQALVTTVSVSRNHHNRAYERFTEHGPLAILPMTSQRMAVAWTLPEVLANELKDMTEADFLSALQDAFGDRSGTFTRVGTRQTYPLSLGYLERPVTSRVVAIGNAAHLVHPVAGQGFNLGLRDVADLSDYLQRHWQADSDPGEVTSLEEYAITRAGQTRHVGRFTDGLITLFTSRLPGAALARSIGLNLIDLSPSAKRFFLKRTMGLHGRLPRLTRGLTSQPPRD